MKEVAGGGWARGMRIQYSVSRIQVVLGYWILALGYYSQRRISGFSKNTRVLVLSEVEGITSFFQKNSIVYYAISLIHSPSWILPKR